MTSYSTEISKLIADGSRAYSSKDFDLASEKYSEACEKFSETHQGNEDADLLFLYGKAVFQSGVSKSEVFGGGNSSSSGQDVEDNKKDDKDDNKDDDEEKDDDDKFQFYADGDEQEQEQEQEEVEEESGAKAEEEEGETQSDFEIAWELLDLARTLFENKLNSLDKGDLKPPYLTQDSEGETNNEYIITMRKLSETYDILGEVSLEAENFNQAADDLNKSLELRLELYPNTSSLITEAHYKLALALEFQSSDDNNVELRKKSAEQMKLAIESLQLQNAQETDPTKKKDNQEMIDEMKEKYRDLLKDPSEEMKNQQLDIIKGILGEEASGSDQSVGTGTGTAAALVNNLQSMVKPKKKTSVTANENKPVVNDLSGSVRKRKKQDPKEDLVKKSKK